MRRLVPFGGDARAATAAHVAAALLLAACRPTAWEEVSRHPVTSDAGAPSWVCAFSPDGRSAITGAFDYVSDAVGFARYVPPDLETPVEQFEKPFAYLPFAQLADDGALFTMGGTTSGVVRLSPEGRQVETVSSASERFSVSDDGARVAGSAGVRVRDADGGWALEHPVRNEHVALSGDGRTLVTWSPAVDYPEGIQLAVHRRGDDGWLPIAAPELSGADRHARVLALRLSRDGATLAMVHLAYRAPASVSGSGVAIIDLGDAARGNWAALRVQNSTLASVGDVFLSADGQRAVVSISNSGTQVWDREADWKATGKLSGVPLALSPGGDTLAVQHPETRALEFWSWR